MSTTRARAPINELADPIELDDGTLMRHESEPPGTIGLQARDGGGVANSGSQTTPLSWARARINQRVGDGECFTLADRALRASSLRSAGDFGTVTPNADYVWGSPVELSDARPGDIIQFRDYSYTRKVTITRADGSSDWRELTEERPHHTAIVQRVNGTDLTVLEQNAPAGSAVVGHTLHFGDRTETAGQQTIEITVRGRFWIYRPQPR